MACAYIPKSPTGPGSFDLESDRRIFLNCARSLGSIYFQGGGIARALAVPFRRLRVWRRTL